MTSLVWRGPWLEIEPGTSYLLNDNVGESYLYINKNFIRTPIHCPDRTTNMTIVYAEDTMNDNSEFFYSKSCMIFYSLYYTTETEK